LSHPLLIAPEPATTPSDLRRSRSGRRAVPADILRTASNRLGLISLLAAGLWFVATLFYHLSLWSINGHDPRYLRLDVPDYVAMATIVLSLGMYRYARRSDHDPRRVLDLGLLYMIVNAFAIGVSWHWQLVPGKTTVEPIFTWVGPIILIFAVIVPNTPRRILAAGMVAASMNPIGMLLERARGVWEFGPTINVLIMHYPDYLLALVAVVISTVVTELGDEVAKARELGSYRLGELLGKGGMGEVYRATHRMLARPAAIKLIRAELAGKGDSGAGALALQRFKREAEVVASLRSPHTVQLYDFGVTDDRVFYLVMELLDGMDLETIVRQKGPLPAERVIHILRQACDSLEEAHASGLVHRDIKPANLHLGRFGLKYDFVKVLDFGLVKSTQAAPEGHSLRTAAGLTPGTPAYLAPELALDEPVDGRTDLYALGCVACYLLTGQLVFQATTGLAMITKHLQEAPVPLSQRTELPIPADLERVVLRCLAKRPSERPESAAMLSAMLKEVAAPRWTQEQAKRWWGVNLKA
jgi:serine/threonine-protein kinase